MQLVEDVETKEEGARPLESRDSLVRKDLTIWLLLVPRGIYVQLQQQQQQQQLNELLPLSSKIQITERLCLEVEGEMVIGTEGDVSDSVTEGNASAEGQRRQDQGGVSACVDTVHSHHFQQTSFTERHTESAPVIT
ncbi:hypothetical protein U0070_024616 [Myodes glareolus]|uniref:Uncharacterized protein n=1 Tax=Myodes glareolus TaxID=447135 RepID=A0AAW0JWZ8_MYOGA